MEEERSLATTERLMVDTLREPESFYAETPEPLPAHKPPKVPEWLLLIVLTAVSSGLIVFYVLLITEWRLTHVDQDNMPEVAFTAAEELKKVTVADPVFGLVGLCDLPADTGKLRARVMGINSIIATALQDVAIAERLKNDTMLQLSMQDLERARMLKEGLRNRLWSHVGGEVYDRAYRFLQSQKPSKLQRLIEFKLTLGTLNQQATVGRFVAVPVARDGRIHERYFEVSKSVPVANSKPISFVALAEETRHIEPEQFRLPHDDEAPSVVLVEATYEVHGKLEIRRSAAVTGAPYLMPERTSILVSFPHGKPPGFSRFSDFMGGSFWTNVGTWQQCSGGDLPGPGHLVPAQSLLPEHPNEAAAVCIYHWLRQMGPTVDPAAVERLFSMRWPAEKAQPYPTGWVRDTGAAEYAVLNQTATGEPGQAALSDAFSFHPLSLPKSAVPLLVGEQGDCVLPGHPTLDRGLLADFLDGLYGTNSAAMDTLRLAKTRKAKAITAIRKAEELFNTTSRLIESSERAMSIPFITWGQQHSESRSGKLLKDRKALLATCEAELFKQREIHRVSQIAISNAEAAALQTFELGSNCSAFMSAGIRRGSQPRSFLLGTQMALIPHVTPLTETDISRAAEGRGKNNIEWLQENFTTVQQGMAAASPVTPHTGYCVIVHSLASGPGKLVVEPMLRIRDSSPFAETGIGRSQLLYYARNCITSGRDSRVNWSMLIRDLVASRSSSGFAPLSKNGSWCRDPDFVPGSCPGLAGEIQIRTPIPAAAVQGKGRFLVNPLTHERVPEIPNLPPSLI